MSSATGHFIAQRISAVMLAVLGLWFAGSINGLHGFGHETVFAFVTQPLNTVLLALMSATLAYHSYLGVQVVIDDYVHARRLNAAAHLASRIAHVLMGLVSIGAIGSAGFGA